MYHHVIFLSPILGSVAPSFQSRHARRSDTLGVFTFAVLSLSLSFSFCSRASIEKIEREREKREAKLADQREKKRESATRDTPPERERRVCKYFPRRDASLPPFLPGKEKGDPLFGVRSIVGIRENYRIAEEKRGRYRAEASERENNGRWRMGGWRWDAL